MESKYEQKVRLDAVCFPVEHLQRHVEVFPKEQFLLLKNADGNLFA